MSEHTRIKGNVIYDHIPYRENGFTYCKYCKKFVGKVEINFHEGWCGDWMQLNCGKCHKAIWVSEFKNNPFNDTLNSKEEQDNLDNLNDEDKRIEMLGVRVFPKNDKKCFICKKPTNHYDCVSVYAGGLAKNKTVYICSKKCYKIDEKLTNEWIKRTFKTNEKNNKKRN